MTRYAKSTTVTTSKSIADIEAVLTRYGATAFSYAWDNARGAAAIQFCMRDRTLRFLLPMPDREDREFTHTPARGERRSATAAAAAYEQAVRSKWRSLLLVVKALLEAVEAGILPFDSAFLPHIVLPDGSTVADQAIPAVETMYLSGKVAPLLQIGPPDRDA